MRDVEKTIQKGPLSGHVLCSLLQECTKERDIENGRRLHGFVARTGLDTVSYYGDHLIRLYAACRFLLDSTKTFSLVLNPTVYTWNSIITAHAKFGDGKKAFQLYVSMQRGDIEPDRVTFSCCLKACSSIGDIDAGRTVHTQILSNGFTVDSAIGNALVDMYAKCSSLEDSQRVFDALAHKDVITWGAIIGGYASQGKSLLALESFYRMQELGVEANDIVFLSVIKACCFDGFIKHGMLVHDGVIRSGFESDVAVGSVLVDMYVKSGSLEDARSGFEKITNKNAVIWGAMIGGYTQHEHGHTVLELFGKMHRDGTLPNKVIHLHVLKACGSIGAYFEGRLIHHQVIECQPIVDVVLGSAVVDMYASCGSLIEAQNVFDMLPHKNVVTLGALVAGYARVGNCDMIEACLVGMQQQGLKLDDLIFTAILTACCHAGQVQQGCYYFTAMEHKYSVQPGMEQYSCLVHLLGSGGCLVEAEDMLQTMPIMPDIGTWRSLLTTSRAHGSPELGVWCLDQATQADPVDAAGYILLSNMYADAQMSGSVDTMVELRKCSCVMKTAGKAHITVSTEWFEFIVNDQDYPRKDEVDCKVGWLRRLMKKNGYVPQSELVLKWWEQDKDLDNVVCA